MRGGMAGVVVDDKENTAVWGNGTGMGKGKGKKRAERRSRDSGTARRLSVSGSKSRPHYLKVITNRFQRKGGFGRGRITAHRPVSFDGSPYEYSLRSDGEGDKRKSFVVFEDDIDSLSSKSRQTEFATDLDTSGEVSTIAAFKDAKLEDYRTLKPQGTRKPIVSRALVQEESKYHVLESIIGFRARHKSMFSAKLRPQPILEPGNQQESGSTTSFETLAARWHRGGRRSLYTQRSLGTSELEDIEQTLRKMDEEDLEKEMHEHDLEKELQEKFHREHEQLFAAVTVSVAHETVMVPTEVQANVDELPPQPSNRQDLERLSPRIDGFESEDEIANVVLITPHPSNPKEKLRLDQEVPLPEPTPVILELGVSPEAIDTDRATKQLIPPASLPLTDCNIQDSDTLKSIPEDLESQLAQTVEAVQVWSVELDPSRRRPETKHDYSNRSPWLKCHALSSLQLGTQVPDTTNNSVVRTPIMSVDHFDRATQLDVSRSLSPLGSSEFVKHVPADNLMETHDRGLLSTNFPFSSGNDLNGKEGDVEIFDGRFSTCPDHFTTGELEMQSTLTENEREMQTWRENKETLRSSRSYCPDESPVLPVHSSAQCNLLEKTPERSLESPSLLSAELLRRVDYSTATPPMAQVSFDKMRMSPTPPRNICLFLGNPFWQMSSEELSKRWLQFCISPTVISDAKAGNKKSWTIESAFTEPECLGPTSSFPSEQVLQRTTEADVLPNVEEEAVSSEGLNGKTSTDNEYLLSNAEEEAFCSDGIDGKTTTIDEDVIPNAEEEALSSDGPDGVMDYEDDFDDMSNDSTRIVKSGSSAYNDQEGTSTLKECPLEDARLGDDVLCVNLTHLRDHNLVEAISGPAVEYSLTHLDEEHIDKFMNSLQVTPGVDVSCLERPTPSGSGEGLSKDATVNHEGQSPADKAGHLSLNKEQVTPGKDKYMPLAQVQDECTPVQKQTKTKRFRKSTRTKKVDSPLDAGSKWTNGQRKSTRIRSKPLDWWRGERMLYGRVHSTLNTLIGIKHLSPDPVWPRPDRRNKVAPQKFRVDSFVSDEHNELLRLAAQ